MTSAYNKFGRLFIVSGPSGAGKTTLVEKYLESYGGTSLIKKAITYTTRSPRATEVDGVDYYFITKDQFRGKIKEGFFLEWAEWADQLYGLGRDIVKDIKRGIHYIAILDRKGMQQVLKNYPEIVSIWIQVSDMHILKERLHKRGSDLMKNIEKRLRIAQKEMEFEINNSLYDYHLENNDLSLSLGVFSSILNQYV